MPKGREGLTPKMRRFCEEYVIDFNASAAAERAGYKQPRMQGHRNMAKPACYEYIQELRVVVKEAIIERTAVNATFITEKLLEVVQQRILEHNRAVHGYDAPSSQQGA